MYSKKPPKRTRLDDRYDSDSDDETREKSGFWPAWLVVEGDDEMKPLSALSPFAIEKGFKNIAGDLVSVKRLKNGTFLVECRNEKQSKKLINATLFIDRKIKVTPHKQLNSSKGVIRCRELKGTSEAEIRANLESQGVIDVHRVSIKKGQVREATNTLFLTFCTPKLPRSIKVGYLYVRVEQYIPSPMRCFKCQKFGHTKQRCTGEEVCDSCGKPVHSEKCEHPVCCVNCGGAHTSSSKQCPIWQTEKEIQRVKTEKRLPFFEAKKLVMGDSFSRKTQADVSYASMVKVPVKKASVACQTELFQFEKTLQGNKLAQGGGKKPATSSAPQQTSLSAGEEKNAPGGGVISTTSPSSSQETERMRETSNPPRDSQGDCRGRNPGPEKVIVVDVKQRHSSTPGQSKAKVKDKKGAVLSDRMRKFENPNRFYHLELLDDEGNMQMD